MARIKLCTIFKVRSDFRGKQFMVYMVGYPEESIVLKLLDMRGSTV